MNQVQRLADAMGAHAVQCARCGQWTITVNDPNGQPRLCSEHYNK